MKIRHSKNPLPRLFYPLHKGIVNEASLRISKKSRLRAKLLIFENNAQMKDFFTRVLDRPHSVTKDTRGVVSALSWTVENYKKGKEPQRFLEVDPVYFCLIGLIVGHLRMEIICHEAVHAAFAYKARQSRRVWSDKDELDEEEICYPAGIIASQINRFLHDEGLYQK